MIFIITLGIFFYLLFFLLGLIFLYIGIKNKSFVFAIISFIFFIFSLTTTYSSNFYTYTYSYDKLVLSNVTTNYTYNYYFGILESSESSYNYSIYPNITKTYVINIDKTLIDDIRYITILFIVLSSIYTLFILIYNIQNRGLTDIQNNIK